MCDPVVLGSMAVSAIGSGISAMEQNKLVEKGNAASQAAYQAELQRQKGFQAEAQPILADATKAQGAEQSLGDLLGAQNSRQQAMTGAIEQAPQYAPPSGANEEIVRQVSKAAGEARDNAMRAGALGGWGDMGFAQALGMQGVNRNMAGIADQAGGSVRLLPMEQEAARFNATRKGTSGLGDLLQLAGKGGMLIGATGFNPFSSASSPMSGLGTSTGASKGFGLRQ